jgi:hypothetical protein
MIEIRERTGAPAWSTLPIGGRVDSHPSPAGAGAYDRNP